MRILVHDFGAYPFIFELSEALARMGHDVDHAYFAELPGPKAAALAPDAIRSYRLTPISLGRPFAKYRVLDRLVGHHKYASAVIQYISEIQPDVVLSANSPCDVEFRLLTACQRNGIAFIHWMQDLYYLAILHVLERKNRFAGRIFGQPFKWMQRHVCEQSDEVVVISGDFIEESARLGFKCAAPS